MAYEDEVTPPSRTEFLRQFRRDGYVLIPPPFLPAGTLETVSSVLPSVLARESPARILERDGVTVRSVYGLHQSEPWISALTRLPVLLSAVRDLLGDEVYVHQSKVNIKAPFAGDQWEWHQDFIYWLHGDGIQKPDLVNVAIFLDEVNEFNGPLTFVPGSHDTGLLAAATAEGILHCSAANISPFRRAMLMFVYNGVRNSPRAVPAPRPAFLAEPNVLSLQPAERHGVRPCFPTGNTRPVTYDWPSR